MIVDYDCVDGNYCYHGCNDCNHECIDYDDCDQDCVQSVQFFRGHLVEGEEADSVPHAAVTVHCALPRRLLLMVDQTGNKR